MINYIVKIVQDLLKMLYEYAGISIIVALLFLIVWQCAEETSWNEVGGRLILQLKDKKWKKRFVTVLYIIFVMQRTLFNRSPWGNPLGNILGPWGLWVDGNPNYEMYENVLLFLPLYPLLKISEVDKVIKHFKCLKITGMLLIPLEVSLVIEITQLMTRAGTFQLSDICYNTLGGFIGGLIYQFVCKLMTFRIKGVRNQTYYEEEI